MSLLKNDFTFDSYLDDFLIKNISIFLKFSHFSFSPKFIRGFCRLIFVLPRIYTKKLSSLLQNMFLLFFYCFICSIFWVSFSIMLNQLLWMNVIRQRFVYFNIITYLYVVRFIVPYYFEISFDVIIIFFELS